MFAQRFVVLAGLMFAAVGLSGCSTQQPLYNAENVSIASGSGTPLSVQQVENAIMDAAKYKRWTPTKVGPGHILATINVRQHRAEVDIYYTANEFDIQYKDSQVLEYDGQNIHRNYNKWVMLLEEQIKLRLANV